MISIIAAVGKNLEIGIDNKMPWHIPQDLALFKKITINHKVIMGRVTYETIGKKLEDRENIIVGKDYLSDIKSLLKYQNSNEEVFVIGGQSIYEYFIPYAKKLYISHIDKEFIATKYFPKINFNNFKIIYEKKYDEFTFRIYERIE